MIYIVWLITEVNKIHPNPFKELCCHYRNARPAASVSSPTNAYLATLEKSYDLRPDDAIVALRNGCPCRMHAGMPNSGVFLFNDIKDRGLHD